MKAQPRRREGFLRLAAFATSLVLAIAVIGFAWWIQPQPLLPQARAAMETTPNVVFAQDAAGRLVYRPSGSTPKVGLIVYPGAKVEVAGYAPTAAAIAERGYVVIVVPMPLNLAVLGADRAADVIRDYPEISTWAITGHSLGGAMAAQFVAGHPGAMRGIALWAAYSPNDISGQSVPVASIYGTLDRGADRITSTESRALLPASSRFVPIEGGNHEQFGWYTGQPDDPPATISRVDQQAQIAASTVALLDEVAPGP